MFSTQNPNLVAKIKASKALAAKLNNAQLETFIQRALTLPLEGQNKLLEQLEAEEQDNLQAQAQALESWAEQLDQNTDQEIKNIRQEAEASSTEEEEKREAELIKSLEE